MRYLQEEKPEITDLAPRRKESGGGFTYDEITAPSGSLLLETPEEHRYTLAAHKVTQSELARRDRRDGVVPALDAGPWTVEEAALLGFKISLACSEGKDVVLSPWLINDVAEGMGVLATRFSMRAAGYRFIHDVDREHASGFRDVLTTSALDDPRYTLTGLEDLHNSSSENQHLQDAQNNGSTTPILQVESPFHSSE